MSSRVFVVEDEALIMMDLSERLRALGYEVCGGATRGETTAQKIVELRPDLVLMDVKLAGAMDGMEVAEQLRERCDVPIVFLTAYSDPELIARASRTNSYGYLVKPFEERELHATLQVALARHAGERDLREQVRIDPLTGLYNRRFLDEMLPIEVNRARREGQTLSVVMIDVDHFKQLNDTYGHDAGDYVLQHIASTLRGGVRASDLVCRYGGEEFTLVMPNTDAQGAAQRIRSICAVVRENAVIYRGRRLAFTLSAGVAAIPVAGGTAEKLLRSADAAPRWVFNLPELVWHAEKLLRSADAALYRAKREGRGRVCEAGNKTEPFC